MIEEIFCWNVTCTPWEKGPIRNMILLIEAKSRKEAELIILDKAHKFFDQDMNYAWSEPMIGYRQIKEANG